jgi:hypothetical protein
MATLGRSGKWFHTLVVVGASMSGCGGRATHEEGTDTGNSSGTGSGGAAAGARPSAAGAGVAGGGAPTGAGVSGAAGADQAGAGAVMRPSPRQCEYPWQFVCDDLEAFSNCRCDPAAPANPTACPSVFDYACVTLPCSAELCQPGLNEVIVGCHCDPLALRPESCATPEQFYCSSSYPYFSDCHCREEPPVDPSACPREYCCQSENPRFGCGCFCAMIK